MTTLQVFNSNILLQEIEAAKTIDIGVQLIVPDKYQNKLNKGKVLDMGPTVSPNIKKGQILFFGLHTESRLEFNGKRLIVVDEAHILGAIEENVNPVDSTNTDQL